MVVPADWKFVELGSVVTTGQLGGNYPNSSVSDGFPLIKMGNLGRGKIDMSSRYFLARGLSPSSLDVLKPNDVLFNTRNTLDLVGKVAIWRNELPAACFNSNIMRLSFDSSVVCNEYANYALNTSVSTKALREMATGTTSVAAIYGRDLWLLPFLLPPLKEQEAIAEALSDADAAIESLDALIAKKRDIRGAVLFNLIVDNGHKNLVSFKSDVSLKARIGWQGLTTGEYEISSDCFLVTGTDLNGGAVDWESCWQVAQKRYDQDPNIQLRNNDVLVTKDGTIGKVGFVAELQGKATLNSGVFVIRPTAKHVIPEYLRYVMFSPLFRRFLDRLAAGSTISHLYQKDFVNFSFAVPSVDEQVSISNALDDVDSEIRSLIEQSKKLRMMKEGMMQDLLTGKVRLV